MLNSLPGSFWLGKFARLAVRLPLQFGPAAGLELVLGMCAQVRVLRHMHSAACAVPFRIHAFFLGDKPCLAYSE